jgi:hypothetical protein
VRGDQLGDAAVNLHEAHRRGLRRERLQAAVVDDAQLAAGALDDAPPGRRRSRVDAEDYQPST